MLAGIGLIAAGLAVAAVCTFKFAKDGRGTPVAFVPPRRLVETGLYRWSRNPMYVAYVAILLGEALHCGSPVLLLYAAAAFLGLHLSVVFQEERELRRRHGSDFDAYQRAVPRWL